VEGDLETVEPYQCWSQRKTLIWWQLIS